VSLRRHHASLRRAGYLAAGAHYVAGRATLNREHPYLSKQLIGLSQVVFGPSLLAGPLPGVVCAVLTAAVVFALGREVAGRWAGLGAAGLWLGLPQAPGTVVLRLDRYALLEPPMVALSMLGLLLALVGGRRLRVGHWRGVVFFLAAGAAVGFATSAKITGVLAMAAVVMTVALSGRSWRDRALLTVGVLVAAAVAFWLPYAAQGDPGMDGLRYAASFQARHVTAGHPQVVSGHLYAAAPWWANGWWQASYLGWAGVLALWTLAGLGLLARPKPNTV
jgi:4-amino-4-deoxy-L-arabinose transferase-like glycosyltransferase